MQIGEHQIQPDLTFRSRTKRKEEAENKLLLVSLSNDELSATPCSRLSSSISQDNLAKRINTLKL